MGMAVAAIVKITLAGFKFSSFTDFAKMRIHKTLQNLIPPLPRNTISMALLNTDHLDWCIISLSEGK